MNGDQRRFRLQLNRQTSTTVLTYLLVLLCLGIGVRAGAVLFQGHAIGEMITQSTGLLQSQTDKAAEYLEAYAKKTEKLTEKGIFCMEKKKPSPPTVTGILGDSALINEKWCKVGEEHAGAKILKIEPTQITILWEGQEKTLAPLLASVPGNSNGKPKPKPRENKPAEDHTIETNSPAEPVAVAPVGDDPLAWLGMEVSAEVRAFLLKLFEVMPAERAEEAKKEWETLSEDQKRKRLDQIQQMVDSGQADSMLAHMKASG
jgi:hypothetical protein